MEHNFVNYQDGQLSVNSYRNPAALGTQRPTTHSIFVSLTRSTTDE
jgi:hypothetical protein